MTMKANTIALFGNCYQAEHLHAVEAFVAALAAAPGVRLAAEADFAAYLAAEAPAAAAAVGQTFDMSGRGMPADTSLAISFGGDGTFLHAAGALMQGEIPLMGINTGHLGFLAGANIDTARELIPDLLAGRYVAERRTMIEVESPLLPRDFPRSALNEVAILKQDTSAMLDVAVRLDGNHMADYSADGLIVSTPTGSTAYNLSVGGPIIDPRCGVMVISPIAPHTLTQRPLVVADSSVISAVATCRSGGVRLSVDGSSVALASGAELTIRRSDRSVLLARPEGTGYIDVLRTKLHWGQ